MFGFHPLSCAIGNDRGQQFIYNGQGYLEQIKEARDQVNGRVYQDIESMDARGNVTHMILGNGIDAYASYESASGRLDTLTAYKGGVEVQNNDYLFDVLGNLKQR